MTSVTIDQLLNIGNTQLPDAKVALQQNGVTFKAPERPNPLRQLNVTSLPQLEAELGINLEISDGDGIAIVIDDAFTVTKSFKIGLGSTLNKYASTPNNTLTSTASVLYENIDPLNGIQSLDLDTLLLIGDTTNSVFDIQGDVISLARFRDVVFLFFNSLGTVNARDVIIMSSAIQGVTQGLVINEPTNVIMDTFGITQISPTTGITAVSIIAGATPVIASMSNFRGTPLFAGDSLLFIDPNSPAGSRYTISTSDSGAGDFYQLGVDIAITNVADNGSGKARFTTDGTAHNLIVGRPTVLSGFVDSTYNRTVIVTAVDTDLTGITFDVDDIDFNATDTGNVNNASLDQESPLVFADKNSSPDSMFTGNAGLEIVGAPNEVTITTSDVPEVISDVNWVYDDTNLERFSIGVSAEGQLVANDVSTRKYRISYSGSIGKVGGGPVNIGIVLLKNGTNIAFNPPRRGVALVAQISGEDIIELTAGDTIQIVVINYEGTSNINVEQISMVVSLA